MELADHDSELAKVATELAAEREHLVALQRQLTDAQEAHAKHLSETNAKLDAREKVQEDASAKAAADHATLSSLRFRARDALSSIRRERFEAPLKAPEAIYAELCSNLAEELGGAALKVDGILEKECRDLFFMGATLFFNHLLLRNRNFNFGEVITPIPTVSRDDLAAAVESHMISLLGKFSWSGDAEQDNIGDDDTEPSS